MRTSLKDGTKPGGERGRRGRGRLILWLGALMSVPLQIHAQPTAFSYQGQLNANGQAASGSYEMQFHLRDALSGGNPVSSTNTLASVAVSNGLFMVAVDFGSNVLTGADLWLEIGVRASGSSDPFTTLAPRQALLSSPYAVFARGAATAGTATNLAPGGVISGNGAGLTNLSGAGIIPGTISSNQIDPAAWRTMSPDAKLYSIVSYGAVGGDVGKDSAGLAAAFQAATNNGGTIYIPAGVYLVTNHLVILCDPALSSPWSACSAYVKVRIRGAGSATSVLKFVGANSTLIESAFPLEISDLGIQNAGFGTNAAIRTDLGPGGNTGPSSLINVTITDFDVGADFLGGAGGYLYGCAFEGNRIGLRLPGYCDGWTVDSRVDMNTVGIELGGVTGVPGYSQITHANGARIHLTGAHNGYAVVVGGSDGTDISGYLESCTNAFFAIGHPPSIFGTQLDEYVGSVHIHNFACLMQPPAGAAPGTFFAGAQVFAPPEVLHISDCRLDPVQIMTNTADTSTYIFEKVAACYLIDSDGRAHYLTCNPGATSGAGSSSFNPDPVNIRYAGSTAAGPLQSKGGFAALGGIFSGNGNGLNNISGANVDLTVGAGLAASTNGPRVTISVPAIAMSITTNVDVPAPDGGTNQLQFVQGVLTRIVHINSH